jgi:hypothetical protein
MEFTASRSRAAGTDDDFGYGRIDALAAVRWARSAGDLRGRYATRSAPQPIQGATATGVKTGSATGL